MTADPDWSDEFDQDGLPDPSRWSYAEGGHGWGNDELQFYTESRLDNARVEDGRLVIEAHREDWHGRPFTSARLVSRGKGDWRYGRIEVVARLPQGRGTWPAIWMLSSNADRRWPRDGEIDIMEHVGHDPGVIHASIHTAAYNHVAKTQRTATTSVPDAQQTFHTYRLDWDHETISCSVDDRTYFSYARDPGAGVAEWPFDSEFHLILNLAVGGFWGGEQGVDEAAFPARMEVDSVRVFGHRDT
ncbi:glycoside hydrolase family 16 protein [Jiangella aurantiaca]|uniref:Glycoside hydrolase family 16 protein n=1 Tax=Jiangella aurantiaca TaxID=2530373 RepID=A0A4R5AIP7_9ACTN|nr:glycoside hydrolase family 16 protein [Jiangella aurantiaca]TDD72638.1 glycoside hydrolase family 16 protein [Jiangella aurantiaca]